MSKFQGSFVTNSKLVPQFLFSHAHRVLASLKGGAWSTACIPAARACRGPKPPGHGLGVTDLPFSPSSRPVDRARRCFCLFCATPAGCSLQCAAVCALVRERRAVEPRPHVWAKLYPLLHAVVLYCMSLWVCSRSAEHVVSAGAQIAANKNMRAAAAQSEASFMPAHCSRNHVPCNIFMNSWPLRCGPKGPNACMIAWTDYSGTHCL